MEDSDARIKNTISENENSIGRNTIDKHNTNIEASPLGLLENRTLLTNLCLKRDLYIVNTHFEKANNVLWTYRFPQAELGPPWSRGRYETLDYIITSHRWKNCIIDVETDPEAPLDSDHFPFNAILILEFVNIKKLTTLNRPKYDECNKQQKEALNPKWDLNAT